MIRVSKLVVMSGLIGMLCSKVIFVMVLISKFVIILGWLDISFMLCLFNYVIKILMVIVSNDLIFKKDLKIFLLLILLFVIGIKIVMVKMIILIFNLCC